MESRPALLIRIRRRLARQDGFALVIGLGLSVVLGIVGTTTIAFTTANQRSANYSKAERSADSLAEAGLNYAYSTLYNASDPTMPGAVPARTVSYDGGQVTYSGTLDEATNTWTLRGTARYRNPTGAADLVRGVRARASTGSATHGSANNAVWNYVYADATTGCTTLGNSVEINVPLYIRGNLCLRNSAVVNGYSLQVGGKLTLDNTSSVGLADGDSGGEAGTAVHEAHIAGGCGADGHDCGPADGVYAELPVDRNTTGLTKPPVDLPGWYQDAKPGPMHGCTSGSFPGGFDTGDGLMNGSRGDIDLTPNSAYDCQVRDAQGTLLGRIAWTPGSPGTLTILGTLFFDGNLEFRNSTHLVYVGRATLYASGTITLRNQTSICGIVGCGSDWNATQNLLAFVAGSSTVATGFSVEQNSTFQGAIYVVNDYVEQNDSTVWGPIIARQLYLQNSTINHYVPMGTLLPGMPATYEEAIAITNEQGSWGN
jgi:Tfp pilus assembly protein PilX